MMIEEEERKKWEEVLAAQREIAEKEERTRAREREDKREEAKKGRLRKKQEAKMQQKIKQKVIEKGEEKEERKQQAAAGNGVLAASQAIQGRGLSQEKDDDASGAVRAMEQGGKDAMEEEADRAMKELLEEEAKTSAAANAVSELLEEEEKDAAAASQKEKTCNERRRRVEDDIKNVEEQCYKQKDTKTTKAASESEQKKIENVAAVPVVAGLKDTLEEGGEQEEEMRQKSAERKEAESMFWAKFNLSPTDVSSGEAPTAGSTTALGPAAAPEEAPAPAKSMSQAAPAAGGAGPRYMYQYLSIATNNFEKRLGSGGCGSVFQGVLASGTRVAVKRLELGVAAGAGAAGLSMTDQMRTEVEVLSQVQHVNIVPLLGWSKDGMAPCLVYALMEGGSLQDRLACRGSGALVPLTANERILVLSDVARGLAYLHSEVRVIHRDVKSANVLLDRGCQGRVGDFGIAKSLNDNNAGIAVTHMQTEHILGTQVYMAPEYKNGNLSMKVDTFAFGLVIIETLTGLPVLSPAVGHRDLLSMFEEDLDNPTKLLSHLDRRACWDQHKPERIGRVHSIAERCLEARRTRRPELVELIPELEEVRRGTEALQALEAERAVGPLVEAEAAEKECCICLKAEEVGKLLALVPCGHRCVCADCSALVVGHTCPVCRTEARQAIRVFD
jgi:interleukin-1 receptor-associated kinase 4